MELVIDDERVNSVTQIVTVSFFKVANEDPEELSNDSSSRVQIPTAVAVVSIVTVAEDAPFAIVTNGSKKALFCRSSIVGVDGRVIVEVTSYTVIYSDFPFKIVVEVAIDDKRVNSYT